MNGNTWFQFLTEDTATVFLKLTDKCKGMS